MLPNPKKSTAKANSRIACAMMTLHNFVKPMPIKALQSVQNIDHFLISAIYLAKRSMRNKQRHGLDDHEQVRDAANGASRLVSTNEQTTYFIIIGK